jgi:hypothetical protein
MITMHFYSIESIKQSRIFLQSRQKANKHALALVVDVGGEAQFTFINKREPDFSFKKAFDNLRALLLARFIAVAAALHSDLIQFKHFPQGSHLHSALNFLRFHQ